jgi:hypothetical protein
MELVIWMGWVGARAPRAPEQLHRCVSQLQADRDHELVPLSSTPPMGRPPRAPASATCRDPCCKLDSQSHNPCDDLLTAWRGYPTPSNHVRVGWGNLQQRPMQLPLSLQGCASLCHTGSGSERGWPKQVPGSLQGCSSPCHAGSGSKRGGRGLLQASAPGLRQHVGLPGAQPPRAADAAGRLLGDACRAADVPRRGAAGCQRLWSGGHHRFAPGRWISGVWKRASGDSSGASSGAQQGGAVGGIARAGAVAAAFNCTGAAPDAVGGTARTGGVAAAFHCAGAVAAGTAPAPAAAPDAVGAARAGAVAAAFNCAGADAVGAARAGPVSTEIKVA